MTPTTPFLSVIVPARSCSRQIAACLEALRASDLPRALWELIVVDDASLDDTASVAARFADTVIRLPGRPKGPAYARNRGAEIARGECLAFIDADVCVHRDTLSRFAHCFITEPDVSAIFGSYDDRPAAPGLVSQYRNLLHHYVHQRSPGEADTFWAACGAVRRTAFLDAGMYDEWHFPRPQIEDIELGNRLRGRRHRIVLRPEIQCTHLKRWSLRDLVTADLSNRGIPWMRLLIQQGSTMRASSLNLRLAEKFNTALLGSGLACLTIASFVHEVDWALAGLLCIALVVFANRGFYAFLERRRGFRFALCSVPLHLIYYGVSGLAVSLGWLLHGLVGEPRPDPVVQAHAEIGTHSWPPVPNRMSTEPWQQPVSTV